MNATHIPGSLDVRGPQRLPLGHGTCPGYGSQQPRKPTETPRAGGEERGSPQTGIGTEKGQKGKGRLKAAGVARDKKKATYRAREARVDHEELLLFNKPPQNLAAIVLVYLPQLLWVRIWEWLDQVALS